MLKDTEIKAAKPKTKPYVISDGGGLRLEVRPSGVKVWRFVYRFAGKPDKVSYSQYPAMTLLMARERRDADRRLLAQGVNPRAKRDTDREEAAKSRQTFRMTGDEWLAAKMVGEGASERTVRRERDWLLPVLYADIGDRPIDELEPPDVLAVIKKSQAKSHHETASRLRSTASRVFQFGVANGYCTRDMAADLRGALTSPTVKPRPAVVEPNKVATLMRDIADYAGRFDNMVGLALQLIALTAVRPGELRQAEWSEFDRGKAATWTIPAAKMKMRREHQVPLSRQALAVLKQLQRMTGNRRYVFAMYGDQPMSDNTLNAALRLMGYDTENEHCAHGFRTTFSTAINSERVDTKPVWHIDVTELCLAHADQDSQRAAYNRSMLWPDRVKLMQHWADRIDTMRNGNVVKLKKTA